MYVIYQMLLEPSAKTCRMLYSHSYIFVHMENFDVVPCDLRSLNASMNEVVLGGPSSDDDASATPICDVVSQYGGSVCCRRFAHIRFCGKDSNLSFIELEGMQWSLHLYL